MEADSQYESLLSFLYMCPVGIVQMDPAGDIELANPYAAQLMLPIARPPTMENFFQALEHCAPELRHLVARFNFRSGRICDQHRIFVRDSGAGMRVMACSLIKVTDATIMAVLQDATTQVEQERMLAQNDVLLDAMVAGISDFALFSIDRLGRIETWNAACVRQTGFSVNEAMGRDMRMLYRPTRNNPRQLQDHIATAILEGWHVQDGWCRRRDGSRACCQTLITTMDGLTDREGSLAVVMRDVTERRLTTDELRTLLTTDHLTGALNRGHFFDLAKRHILRCEQTGQKLSVLMMDIDHFKLINDEYGHAAGDEVLRRLVASCRAQLADEHVLARLGGEEFAVLLPQTSAPEAERIGHVLRLAVAGAIAAGDNLPSGTTISIGCATVEHPIPGIDDILRMADEALYRAKRAGRNRVCMAMPQGRKETVLLKKTP
jgi:diguanylate cyclase (GGDEF)-like protein/PAS domain S-box-containing protein